VKKKFRMTKQRQMILSIIRNTDCHPTADWVYQEARKEIPGISLGTVYRNLQLLVKEQEILELTSIGKFSRFDGNTDPHYHFICTGCGGVKDMKMKALNILNEEVQAAAPGKIEGHRLEFLGMCNDCLNQGCQGNNN
jgi:Fe2+ or Zn2+ uptake regulation protein